MSDTKVVDAIATFLGTSDDWKVEYLETVADLIGAVRPHPGEFPAQEYAHRFTQHTGRPAADWHHEEESK